MFLISLVFLEYEKQEANVKEWIVDLQPAPTIHTTCLISPISIIAPGAGF